MASGNAKKGRMTQVWKNDAVVPVTKLELLTESASFLNDINEGDFLTVTGWSKGRGFQGVVKRHGFHGGPKSHGQKDRLRAPGSLGPTAPQRVIKGRKMAGHMGDVRVTVRNLRVIEKDTATRSVLLKGAIPGPVGSMIVIKKK